ncbi:MAG: glutathione synthase [Arenicellales bacterium]|jgi:glutathione synthase|nr:glutathione synthase [Arenicellales bacterium]
MRISFIMDPLERVKPWKDTSYYLMLAACQRGHQVCHINPSTLSLDHDRVSAGSVSVDVTSSHQTPFRIIAESREWLDQSDVVMVRTDPPFDRRYFYITLMLDLLPASTRVINRPSTLRDWNEKLAALYFPSLTPQTLVSCQHQEIVDFISSHGRTTLKPVDGHGGKGVVFVSEEDPQRDELISQSTNGGKHWIIAQRYLPEASEGDKRILLLNGEPLGAILRVHAEGEELNNLDAGGSAQKSTLNERDLEICAALQRPLQERGVYFAGIDIIGGQLIEINVTSPTGLQELSQFNSEDYHHQIIAGLETSMG